MAGSCMAIFDIGMVCFKQFLVDMLPDASNHISSQEHIWFGIICCLKKTFSDGCLVNGHF